MFLFSRGAAVTPAPPAPVGAPVGAVAAAPPAAAAPATSLERAAALRAAAQVPYNIAVAENRAAPTNATKKTLKNTKNVLLKARETYATQLRATKKKGNTTRNANDANAAAAELMDSKGASSKFFDNVLNPKGSAINRYFKRKIDFDIFDNSNDMNPEYINNETKGDNFIEYITQRITTKSNSNQTYTDRKETITSYKLVGTQLLNDPNDVYIRIYGMTQTDAKDKLQLYITELRKSVDAEKKSVQVWAQRKAGAYKVGMGVAAAAAALPVGLLYGTGLAAKSVAAARSPSALAELTKRVDVLSRKVDALVAASTGTPGTLVAALSSGARRPAIDFTAVLNTVEKTDELEPKLRGALEAAGVAEDKIVKILAAANVAWEAARGGITEWRVAAAAAAQAALNAPTAGGRRPSRRNHKKRTMMTRHKKSMNKKH